MADAMSMGMGLANAGVQFAGQQANQRQANKINSTNRRMTKRSRANQLEDLKLAGDENNRQANDTMTGITRDSAGGDDGEGTSANFYSSQRKDSTNRVEGERKLRQDAITRERQRLESQWHDEDKIYKAQKRMAKTQKYMDLASSLLNSGAGGMGM